MLAKAATITIEVLIDMDTLHPDISADILVEPEFTFLANNRDIIAGWIRSTSDDLLASDD